MLDRMLQACALMADDPADHGEGVHLAWIALPCLFGLFLIYLAGPGIFIALTGDVPPILLDFFKPLERLYATNGTYEGFINWCRSIYMD